MVRSCTQLHRYIRSLDKTQNFFEGIRFILDTCGPTDILRSLDGIQNFFLINTTIIVHFYLDIGLYKV